MGHGTQRELGHWKLALEGDFGTCLLPLSFCHCSLDARERTGPFTTPSLVIYHSATERRGRDQVVSGSSL